MADKKSKFGLGLIVGVIGGALAGIFLSPKSGRENREAVSKKINELKEAMDKGELQEKVKEIFGDVSDRSVKFYNEARDEVMSRLDTLRDRAEDIDRDKYIKLVNQSIDDLKEKNKLPGDKLKKIKDYFIADWNKLTKSSKK